MKSATQMPYASEPTSDLGLAFLRRALAFWIDHRMMDEQFNLRMARAVDVILCFVEPGAPCKLSHIPIERRTEFLRFLKTQWGVETGDFS